MNVPQDSEIYDLATDEVEDADILDEDEDVSEDDEDDDDEEEDDEDDDDEVVVEDEQVAGEASAQQRAQQQQQQQRGAARRHNNDDEMMDHSMGGAYGGGGGGGGDHPMHQAHHQGGHHHHPHHHHHHQQQQQQQHAHHHAAPQAAAAAAPQPQAATGAQPAAGKNRGGGNGTTAAVASTTAANADFDDDPGLDGYQRTDLIGQGAYGVVYRGTQRSSGETVAIKRIPFADATPEGGVPCNVIREISLLRELDHPNVVKLLDVIQAQPGGLYLVFEFVSFDLKSYMDQQQVSEDINERVGLPQATVRSFLKQILAGVGFCHTYRVLHRDLKPHNLLISADGRQLKLADFGLARLSGLPNGPYTYEVVTLWYRAPELLLGANRYSAAVDVWSIGCIFAEMATGLPLFPGRSDIDQLFKIFQRRGTPTADMWPAVVRLPHFNHEFPQWKERPMTDFMPLESLGGPAAVDLLTKILQYDPDRRLACKMALQHAYFFEH